MTDLKFILYRGRGPLRTLIRWQTRGPYSHASLLVDGITIYESDPGGVVRRPVLQRDLDQDIFVTDVPDQPNPHIVEWLDQQVGKGYDYTMVLRFISRRSASRATLGKWFCSELVFAAYIQWGLPLFSDFVEPWMVSPNDLAWTPLARKL